MKGHKKDDLWFILTPEQQLNFGNRIPRKSNIVYLPKFMNTTINFGKVWSPGYELITVTIFPPFKYLGLISNTTPSSNMKYLKLL